MKKKLVKMDSGLKIIILFLPMVFCKDIVRELKQN